MARSPKTAKDRIDGYVPKDAPTDKDPWAHPALLKQMEARARNAKRDARPVLVRLERLSGLEQRLQR